MPARSPRRRPGGATPSTRLTVGALLVTCWLSACSLAQPGGSAATSTADSAATGGSPAPSTADSAATGGSPEPVSSPAPTESSSPAGPMSPSGPTSPSSPDPPRRVSIAMNGDILLHEGLWATARIDAARTGRGGPEGMDFRPLLADLRPVMAGADLAICHLETPLAPRGGPYAGYPLFAAPPAILPALRWAGYDACTTASNHSLDQGVDGLRRTLRYLDAAGIASAGTAATRRDSRTPVLLQAGGATVGLISATYGTNGLPLPPDQPWSVPLIDVERIQRQAAHARNAGADVVLVALHWGLEYLHDPTDEQVAIARELTRNPDIDFVYGHHAHVVQPYDKVNGTWVAYGLGNAVAQQSTSVEGVYDGNTCRVTFEEQPDGTFEVVRLEYLPTRITPFDGTSPMRWLNVRDDLRDPRYADRRAELQATNARVTAVIGSRGAFRQGVVPGR